MIAIIHIPHPKPAEHWFSPKGKQCVRTLADRAAKVFGRNRVWLVSADSKAVPRFGLKVAQTLLRQTGRYDFQNDAAVHADMIQAALAGHVDDQTPVAVIDYRAAALSEDDLATVRDSLKADPDRVYLSVTTPRYHPCRLSSSLRAVSGGVLVRLDAGASGERGWFSRPIAWEIAGLSDTKGADRQDVTPGTISLQKKDGRLVFARKDWPEPVPDGLEPAGFVFARDDADSNALLYRRKAYGNYILRLTPSASLLSESVELFPASGPDAVSVAAVKERGADSVLLDLDEDVDAWLWFATANVTDGNTSIEQPFTFVEQLWAHTPGGNEPVDPKTGKHMQGRQNYPEVLQFDGAIVAGRLDALGKFGRGAAGDLEGVEMSASPAMVETGLELLLLAGGR